MTTANAENKRVSRSKKEEDISDPVNHPKHYAELRHSFEPIDICEFYNFNVGNAIKYILRAGKKEGNDELTDLKKALWYMEREWKVVSQTSEAHAPDVRGYSTYQGLAAILVYAAHDLILMELLNEGDLATSLIAVGTYTRGSFSRAKAALRRRIEEIEKGDR